MNLTQLPVEITENIASFLMQKDLLAFSRVCHEIYDITYRILWEAIAFIDQFPTVGLDQLDFTPDMCYACTISSPKPVTNLLIGTKFRCYHSVHSSFKCFLAQLANGEISSPTCQLVRVISIFDFRGTEAMTNQIKTLSQPDIRNCLVNVSNIQLFVANYAARPVNYLVRFLRTTDKFYLIQDTMRNPVRLTMLIKDKGTLFFQILRWLDVTISDDDYVDNFNSVLSSMINLESLYIGNACKISQNRNNGGFRLYRSTFAAMRHLERFRVSGEVVSTLMGIEAADLLPVTTSVKFDLSLQDDTTAEYLQTLEVTTAYMKTQTFEHIRSCSFLWSHVGSWNQVYSSAAPVKLYFPRVTKLELWLARYQQERDLIESCPNLNQLILKEVSLQSIEFVQHACPQLRSLSFSMVNPELPSTASVAYTRKLLHALAGLDYLEYLAVGYQEVTAAELTGEQFLDCLSDCARLAQVAFMIPTKGFYGARRRLFEAFFQQPVGTTDKAGSSDTGASSRILEFVTEGRYIYIDKMSYNALYLDMSKLKEKKK